MPVFIFLEIGLSHVYHVFVYHQLASPYTTNPKFYFLFTMSNKVPKTLFLLWELYFWVQSNPNP